MKDKSLHKVAEHLYVQDFLNLEETAKRVGVNERTIRRWQGKNNWLEKRRQFIEQHSHIHEDLPPAPLMRCTMPVQRHSDTPEVLLP